MNADVRQWPSDSLERKAYDVAATIPAVEENDTYRLGYHIYLHLRGDISTLRDAVHVAQARTLIDTEEVVQRLSRALESYMTA
jgi:hypothetical protein